MSQQQESSSSLLSLSIAASNAQPIPLHSPNTSVNKHHRRLSSTGKTRRRLSDARDAANRPTYRSTAAAALSLASLSLSSSPPSATASHTNHATSTSLGTASSVFVNDLSSPPPSGTFSHSLKPETAESPADSNTTPNSLEVSAAKPIPIVNGKNKKRGMDHKCETCSKIYRHPSCLIKHRWEHTPHWREASKYVLSKHQQVQLLEAAAILSHLSPSSSSLPDDRSLWPSFLSGGSLPPPENIANFTSYSPSDYANHAASSSYGSSHRSPRQANSVPTLGTNYYRSSSSYPSGGPRLHDYTVPSTQGTNTGVTRLRPGLVGVSTKESLSLGQLHAGAVSKSIPASSPRVPPLAEEEEDTRPSPPPSLKSGSRSRSHSASISEDEMSSYTDPEKPWNGFHGRRYTDVDDDLDDESGWNAAPGYGRKPARAKARTVGHDRQEEWDGMEMDMEMD